ncbi:MAG: hypothetical protein JWM32_1604 [Verrucomicrobia bacterium]|nr:hypothetical protein [Verrucomicrobiota bacterium]
MKTIIVLLLFFVAMHGSAVAQPEAMRVSQLELRVATLENKIGTLGGASAIAFLFGAFCALWAQNTGRNAWLWFFTGFIFSIFAVLVVLIKNGGDRDHGTPGSRKRFELQDYRQQ